MKVNFRKLRESDAYDLFRYKKLIKVSKYLFDSRFTTIDDAKKFIKFSQTADDLIFGITVDDRVLGVLGIEKPQDNRVYVRIELSPEVWGSTLSDRTMKWIIRLVKLSYPDEFIAAEVHHENIHGIHFLRRTGFEFALESLKGDVKLRTYKYSR